MHADTKRLIASLYEYSKCADANTASDFIKANKSFMSPETRAALDPVPALFETDEAIDVMGHQERNAPGQHSQLA